MSAGTHRLGASPARIVWGPAAGLMAVIFVLSSLPDLPAPPGGMSDVGAHAVVYAGLGTLLLRALAGARWQGVTIRSAATAVLLAVLYGATDEYHQSFVVGRFAALRDLVADGVGAGVGVGVVWAWSIVFSMQERGGNR